MTVNMLQTEQVIGSKQQKTGSSCGMDMRGLNLKKPRNGCGKTLKSPIITRGSKTDSPIIISSSAAVWRQTSAGSAASVLPKRYWKRKAVNSRSFQT